LSFSLPIVRPAHAHGGQNLEYCASRFSTPGKPAEFLPFVDKEQIRGENLFMRTYYSCRLRFWLVVGAPALLASAVSLPSVTAFAASTIYWCPDRKGDQQYSAKPGAGCVPLVQKDEQATQEEVVGKERPKREYRVENLQSDVSEFLKRYRHFLECCKTDLTELRQVQDLGDEVGDLLASTQAQISNHSLASRGIMLREMIPPVAKARADLKMLRARMEQIGTSSTGLDNADSVDDAAREARKLRELEDSIARDFRAPQLPGGPRTGVDLGVAPSVGPGIGRSPKSVLGSGSEGTTGQDIGVSPRAGSAIGGSGPTGFEIGRTGRAGPGIGQSTFNDDTSSGVGSSLQRSTVGSSISDSTVGSSLGTSSVGSSLQDTSVGSSFGGPSAGSSLQDR
jgi:hypothetical protein